MSLHHTLTFLFCATVQIKEVLIAVILLILNFYLSGSHFDLGILLKTILHF